MLIDNTSLKYGLLANESSAKMKSSARNTRSFHAPRNETYRADISMDASIDIGVG